jgi:hypothetical protein
MVRKMGTDNLNDILVWQHSLVLLYQACEPLIFDCLRSEEEYAELIRNIIEHTYYCHCVKRDIDHGVHPDTYDEWCAENKAVEGNEASLETPNSREFGDLLTKMYNG